MTERTNSNSFVFLLVSSLDALLCCAILVLCCLVLPCCVVVVCYVALSCHVFVLVCGVVSCLGNAKVMNGKTRRHKELTCITFVLAFVRVRVRALVYVCALFLVAILVRDVVIFLVSLPFTGTTILAVFLS